MAQEKVTLSGYLFDAANGETLIGATVYLPDLQQGAVTNVYGFYSLTLAPGVYRVQYRYVGFTPVVREIDLSENQRIDIELNAEGQLLEEVVVTGTVEDLNVSGMQMGTHGMNINTISSIPPFMGEVDVLKSIQFLPGVSTVGEGASGFNVRGGGVGQNLVLLDEAPVYNSSHMLGFFSVFNPDAVKDIQLIKGGIPAKYGGRIASILDIRMKEGNNKKLTVSGGIGSVFSRIAVEGPIKKDVASFIVAARRSYIDAFAKAFTDVLDDGAALNFYDLTLKTNYNIDKRNRVYLSGYFGRDQFKFDQAQGFNWGNNTGTLRWNHIFNQRLFSNFTLFFSDYDYELAFGDDELDKFDWNSRIRTFNFKPEFSYFINPENQLAFGGEFINYDFEPANAVGVSNGEVSDVSVEKKNGIEWALYVSNDQKFGERWEAQYGLRYSRFMLVGPGQYYEFDNPEPGMRRSVTNTLFADKGAVIQSYGNLEPRISLKYQVSPSSSVKATYNRTAQYIHLISNTTASNPLDIWTPSTNNIKPQLADQWGVGYFRNFGTDNNFETSIELYYRKSWNQIDYIDGADLLINKFIEGDLLNGDGRAYGVELYIKKNKGLFNGWVSYTLSNTELQINGINNNQWYPTRYDQRHNFKAVVFYEPESRWKLSANFTLLSGTPATFPTSRLEVQDYLLPYNYYNSRNNLRIPVFHRLDFSATLKGKTKRRGKDRKNEDYWVFSIYNAYGRRNPFSIYFAQAETRPQAGQPIESQATQVSIIGTIVPAISYNFKF
ncbi:MAG: collagen-binding protein [Cyclobacteriaceae bacterium]|nr:MAG: collagen-binding protein [Cyclobacteriaceae bacterium]